MKSNRSDTIVFPLLAQKGLPSIVRLSGLIAEYSEIRRIELEASFERVRCLQDRV